MHHHICVHIQVLQFIFASAKLLCHKNFVMHLRLHTFVNCIVSPSHITSTFVRVFYLHLFFVAYTYIYSSISCICRRYCSEARSSWLTPLLRNPKNILRSAIACTFVCMCRWKSMYCNILRVKLCIF